MTLILGTPIIPYKIITLISTIVIPKDTPPVKSISLRNKEEGSITGNWGYFYGEDYRITLCVPQTLKNYTNIRKHTKKEIFIEDKLEFIAGVLGHELYHRDLWHLKEWLEVGAELYEDIAMKLWRTYLKGNQIYERVASSNP